MTRFCRVCDLKSCRLAGAEEIFVGCNHLKITIGCELQKFDDRAGEECGNGLGIYVVLYRVDCDPGFAA